jgi:metal-dependent amidase/aminoacylase/carboxypeptidase family protein
MSYCRRVPPFPLDPSGPLVSEVSEALRTDAPADPEGLDALFCVIASVRRHIHAHPEPGWEETGTNAFLRTMLTRFAGIDPAAISPCTSTGLFIDIEGTGPPAVTQKSTVTDGEPPISVIALRADMDALRMTEGNTGLPYRSQNEGVAHLCGHDGHMACLVGAAALLQQRRHLLPTGKRVRLLVSQHGLEPWPIRACSLLLPLP